MITYDDAIEKYFDDFWDELEDSEKIDIFNRFCADNSYEESIFNMCEFEEMVQGQNIMDVIRDLDDEFDPDDDYFWVDDSGDYCSSVDPCEDLIEDYTYDIMSWMNRNEIQDFWDWMEENHEEETEEDEEEDEDE